MCKIDAGISRREPLSAGDFTFRLRINFVNSCALDKNKVENYDAPEKIVKLSESKSRGDGFACQLGSNKPQQGDFFFYSRTSIISFLSQYFINLFLSLPTLLCSPHISHYTIPIGPKLNVFVATEIFKRTRET